MKKMLMAVCAALTLALIGCSADVEPDGGVLNGGRYAEGLTKDKFWKTWSSVAGIQCWGCPPAEQWGQQPIINLGEGTITSSQANGTMFPVFGLYDNGTAIKDAYYDVSNVSKVEFDYYASGDGTMEFAVFGKDVYKEKVNLSKTRATKSVSVNETGTDITMLIWFSCAPGEAGFVLHIENLAFYDANGNQIRQVPVVYQ